MEAPTQTFYTEFLIGALITDELSYQLALKGSIFEHHRATREIRHHPMPSPVADNAITMVSVKGHPHYVITSEWVGHGILKVEFMGGEQPHTTSYTQGGVGKLLNDVRVHLGLRSAEELLPPLEEPDSREPSRAE
jgi:hypothetical protein